MDDYRAEEKVRPCLEDKVYTAQAINYNYGPQQGQNRKLYVYYRIIDGEHQGLEIFQAFNMPAKGGKLKQGSKYYRTWVQVNGLQRPSRNAILSPKIFMNKVYAVQTRQAKPKLPNNKPMPKEYWYSVVDYIVDVLNRPFT